MNETTQTSPEGVTRTPTGEIAATPTPTEQPKPLPTSSSTQPETIETEARTLLNEGVKPLEQKAPEKYEFKAPEGWDKQGWELDGEILDRAVPIFKDLNLTQDQAQKLVSFYALESQKQFESSGNLVDEMREGWRKEIKADPQIGHKLDSEVKPTVGKALEMLGPKLANEFRQAMDLTGVGDNPAFIRVFYELAKMVTEGGHVAARGVSRFGTVQPNARPETAAKALYPNLP